MTKAELVDRVVRETSIPKKNAKMIVDTIFQKLVEALKKGEKIEFRGFGTFRNHVRNERMARNPKTGTVTKVPRKKVIIFKPHKNLKNKIH